MNGLNLVSISIHLCLFFFLEAHTLNIQILVDKDFSREMIQLSKCLDTKNQNVRNLLYTIFVA